MIWRTPITTQAHARFPSSLDVPRPSHKLRTTLTLQHLLLSLAILLLSPTYLSASFSFSTTKSLIILNEKKQRMHNVILHSLQVMSWAWYFFTVAQYFNWHRGSIFFVSIGQYLPCMSLFLSKPSGASNFSDTGEFFYLSCLRTLAMAY